MMPGSLPARYRVLGLMGSGGSARDLIMATLGVRDHVRFDRMAAAAPAGAGGVLCLATLAGASAPEPDGRARGMLVGLSLATSSNDIARAVLEGVALEMRAIIEAMETAIPTPTVVSLTGGGSRSTRGRASSRTCCRTRCSGSMSRTRDFGERRSTASPCSVATRRSSTRRLRCHPAPTLSDRTSRSVTCTATRPRSTPRFDTRADATVSTPISTNAPRGRWRR